MKKILLFICSLGFLLSQVQAQEDWLCVYPNKKVYFEDSNKSVYCIRIDSTFKNDSILYPFSDLHQIDWDCYSITDGSWLSKYVALDKNGNTIFVNGKNQHILIKNKAALNEIWDVFENENIKVKGEITSIELKSVLGVEDSVKTISFSVFNLENVPVNHLLNTLTIEVSKSFGLVKTVNFYYFEHSGGYSSPNFGEFNLIGISNPQLGFQNINKKEQYFDFQVGDELHTWYLYEAGITWIFHNEEKTIKRYISRTDYSDSIVYSYERKFNRTIIQYDGTTNFYASLDTLKQTIVKGLLFNTEPNEPYVDGDVKKVTIWNIQSPVMRFNDNYHISWQPDTPCLQEYSADVCEINPAYYLGLGGPYYYCYFWMDIENYNKLVYYKKGDITYGTPLHLELSISENKEDNFNIYVNNNSINILTDENIEVYLYTISGIPLFNKKFTEQNITIPVAFPKGVYLVKIISNNKTYIKKILLN